MELITGVSASPLQWAGSFPIPTCPSFSFHINGAMAKTLSISAYGPSSMSRDSQVSQNTIGSIPTMPIPESSTGMNRAFVYEIPPSNTTTLHGLERNSRLPDTVLRSLGRSRIDDAFSKNLHLFTDASVNSENDSASVEAIIHSRDCACRRRRSFHQRPLNSRSSSWQSKPRCFCDLIRRWCYSVNPAERYNNCSTSTIKAFLLAELQRFLSRLRGRRGRFYAMGSLSLRYSW